MATYAGLATSLGIENACSNDGVEILELLPHTDTQTSSHSSSSEEYSTDDFCQLDSQNSVNSSLNMTSLSPHCLDAHSAFTAYIKADPKATLHLSTPAQILHKTCFRLFTQIDERRKLERQMSILMAPPPPPPHAAAAANNFQVQKSEAAFRNKSAFERLVAERNRRVKLKQLFSNICSLLPRNSKKDKHSILANTTTYLRELKTRVADLEQRNRNLKEMNQKNIPNKDEGSSGFDSHHQRFDSEPTILYRSDEIALEQCKNIPRHVNVRISVLQTDLISCPATVLMKILPQLKAEQLEVLSMESHTDDAFWFHANILVGAKGEEWDTSKWQNFGGVVAECFISNRDHICIG